MQTKPVEMLPDVAAAFAHVDHSTALTGTGFGVGVDGLGVAVATAVARCFCQTSFVPTFLQMNFVPFVTLT
jgi:hypothetical protein